MEQYKKEFIEFICMIPISCWKMPIFLDFTQFSNLDIKKKLS